MRQIGAARVVIAGGGIAGAALALFLRKMSISAIVYEAASTVNAAGAGLALAPNGVAVLDALGLAEAVSARGAILRTARFRNERGREFARMPMMGRLPAPPSLAIMRYDLNAVLHESLVRCDIPVHHGKRLVRIDNIARANGPLIIHFDDGATAEADLVIGADGIHSRVRQAIAPDAKPTFAGINGIGGRTPLDRVRGYDAGPDEMTFVFGPRGFFGYSACGGDHAMWWTNLARSQPGTPSAEGSSGDLKKQLLDRFGRYSGPIATLIEHGEGIYAGDVFDLQTLPRWSQGRAVLIGDAAHAVSPNSGQGASMALEDAMLLARLIGAGHSSASSIFKTFEAARRERCEKIVAEGRRRSSGKMELPRLRSDLRNLAMSLGIRLFGAGASNWMYDHRIE